MENLTVVIVALVVFGLGVLRPTYNWDMIGYVASAYRRDGLAGEQLSRATFGAIRDEVGAAKFRELTTGPYRSVVHSDPASLEQNVPFYAIRIVYVELLRLLRLFGAGYPQASYWVSAFFAAASVILLGLFCRHLAVSPFWLPVVVAFADYGQLAGRSNPDIMAGFAALLAIYLLIRKNACYGLVAATLPLLRTDFAICSLAIAAVAFATEARKWPAILGASAALASYALVNAQAGNYSFLVLFNFTFILSDPYPREMTVATDLARYAAVYARNIPRIILHVHMLLYAALLYCVLIKKIHRDLPMGARTILLVCALYTFGHLALFPAYRERFFAFSVALLSLVLLVCMRSWIGRQGVRAAA